MPEADRAKEEQRLKEVVTKLSETMGKVKADKSKFGIA